MKYGLITDPEEVRKRADDGTLTGLWKMTDAVYNKCIGLRNTVLSTYSKSPANAKLMMDGGFETKDYFTFGSAVHSLLLEGPKVYAEQVAVRPVVNLRTNIGKQAIIDFDAANNGKLKLSRDDDKLVKELHADIKTRDIYSMIEGGINEVVAFAEMFGVLCKVKIDCLKITDEFIAIIDVKTTKAETLGEFERSIYQYDYEAQLAFYGDVLEQAIGKGVDAYYFFGIEKKKPFKIFPVRLTNNAVNLGRQIYQKNLSLHIQSTESGEFSTDDDEIIMSDPPAWKVAKHNN